VCNRRIKVVAVNTLSLRIGPFWTPAIGSRSQAIASFATKLASVEGINNARSGAKFSKSALATPFPSTAPIGK
jgi:hypothetical protein